MMFPPRLIAAAALAASLTLPALAVADTPAAQRQTRPGMGAFTGAGNLWSGDTRSAGGPPGAVPGTAAGQAAHQRGIADQQGKTAGQTAPAPQGGAPGRGG